MKCCYKWKKIIACITAAAMSLGMCACGNQGSGGEKAGASDSAEVSEAPSGEESSAAESSEAEEAQESQAEPEGEQGAAEVTYPLKEKVHLTLAMVGEAAVTANATDLAATPFGQAWQEATGVELEIMQLADNEALNLDDVGQGLSAERQGYPALCPDGRDGGNGMHRPFSERREPNWTYSGSVWGGLGASGQEIPLDSPVGGGLRTGQDRFRGPVRKAGGLSLWIDLLPYGRGRGLCRGGHRSRGVHAVDRRGGSGPGQPNPFPGKWKWTQKADFDKM